MADGELIRVSDAERQRVVDELTRHCADGRLTLEEAEERMGEAWAARTRADLAAVLRDLPRSAPRRSRRPEPVRACGMGYREHLRVYVVMAAIFLSLWVFGDAEAPTWLAWWGIGVAAHGAASRPTRREPAPA